MNKNTLGPLAVVLVGVAAFGTMLAISEQPTSCPCYSSSSPNPWYPCLHNPCPKETLSLQGLSSSSHRFDSVEGCLTRLPTKKAGLEIQAKVCDKCGQLVLTYRQSMSCIVCGGPLKPVKSAP